MTTPGADVVIVAAGSSTRMDGVDKLAAPIGGRPLLDWTVSAFAAAPEVHQIVVVMGAARVAEAAVAAWLPHNAAVVAGGARRQESVAAGVAHLERAGVADDRIVLVHDGARPAVRPELISRVVGAVAAHGAAIPVVPVVETLKRIQGGTVAETVDRDALGFAQTPQGVRLDLLRTAWARFPPADPATFTDEAALLEACTIPVHVVPGELDNLKVTMSQDLARARGILAPVRTGRTGFGHDSHPFGPGSPLHLGGIEIEGAPRLLGHSDGDVVLHAIADALLGAAGLGDLGRIFPADDRTPRGIASTELLAEVGRRVRDAGLEPGSIDITVLGARPRLADHLDAMRTAIAELVGIDPAFVNVKASTGNLEGGPGAGRGIEAYALALVRAGGRQA